MWPPYKKTYYKKGIYSHHNFKPFFNKIKENMEENKSIKHYKWFYYYDEKIGYFTKIELVCCYHISGIEKKIWVFETNKIFYIDKTGTKHLSIDLVKARHEENLLAGDLYKSKTIYWKKDKKNFKEFKNKNNQLIGYNIHTGYIQYEIIFE